MRGLAKLIGKAALLLGVAAASGEPKMAAACSCSSFPIYESDPKAGATGVELNRAVMVMGDFVTGTVMFEEVGGPPVAFDATHGPTPTCPGSVSELIPRQPLRPNTRYVVRVRAVTPGTGGDESFEFTTGTQLLSDAPLAKPQGSASMLSSVPPDGFGCGSGMTYACLSIDDDDDMEIIALRGSQTVMRWMARDTQNTFNFESAPDCFEVRRRSATGKRSEPLSICGDALKQRPFRLGDRDSSGVILCEDGRIGGAPASMGGAAADSGVPAPIASAMHTSPQTAATQRADAGGCAVAPAPQRGAYRFVLLAALFALAFTSRRRRRSGASRSARVLRQQLRLGEG